MAENSLTRVVTVNNSQGLHARPAHALVSLTSQYDCNIEIIRDGEAVDGKSILSILTLGAEQGVQLTLRASGRDADVALDALEAQFAKGFGENGDEAQEQKSQTSG